VLKEKAVAIKIREQELLVVEERLAGRQRVFNQHEEHVKDTEAYVARERERLDAFDMGVKMREEAVAEHKQELVLCHNGPLLDLLTCISFECFVLN
jgi:thiamine kinase-like enzyme